MGLTVWLAVGDGRRLLSSFIYIYYTYTILCLRRAKSLLLRTHIRSHLVLGHPFVHDMVDVFPSNIVKVSIFPGPKELSATTSAAGSGLRPD